MVYIYVLNEWSKLNTGSGMVKVEMYLVVADQGEGRGGGGGILVSRVCAARVWDWIDGLVEGGTRYTDHTQL